MSVLNIFMSFASTNDWEVDPVAVNTKNFSSFGLAEEAVGYQLDDEHPVLDWVYVESIKDDIVTRQAKKVDWLYMCMNRYDEVFKLAAMNEEQVIAALHVMKKL
jgi:hypothetical protein